VAKEVVRLLGELGTEEAYQELLALADQETLHRDIRVALLRALWSYLERTETWEIMEKAVASSDPAVASATGRIPAEGLSVESQVRLVRLLARLLAYSEPKVRKDTLERCGQLPVADRERQLLPPLLRALASPLPDECTQASYALLATYTGEAAKVIGEAIRELLPKRRNLQQVINQLESVLKQSRSYYVEAGRAGLEALSTDRLVLSLHLRLAVQVLSIEELAELFISLAESESGRGLHAEGLMAAIQALSQAGSRFEEVELAQLETMLAKSSDERLRRLALATLVAQTQPPAGWNNTKRNRLQVYQDDPIALVASAAQFTFPPLE
jgi:hypothetical protein